MLLDLLVHVVLVRAATRDHAAAAGDPPVHARRLPAVAGCL